jgi:hypothetical protein
MMVAAPGGRPFHPASLLRPPAIHLRARLYAGAEPAQRAGDRVPRLRRAVGHGQPAFVECAVAVPGITTGSRAGRRLYVRHEPLAASMTEVFAVNATTRPVAEDC